MRARRRRPTAIALALALAIAVIAAACTPALASRRSPKGAKSAKSAKSSHGPGHKGTKGGLSPRSRERAQNAAGLNVWLPTPPPFWTPYPSPPPAVASDARESGQQPPAEQPAEQPPASTQFPVEATGQDQNENEGDTTIASAPVIDRWPAAETTAAAEAATEAATEAAAATEAVAETEAAVVATDAPATEAATEAAAATEAVAETETDADADAPGGNSNAEESAGERPEDDGTTFESAGDDAAETATGTTVIFIVILLLAVALFIVGFVARRHHRSRPEAESSAKLLTRNGTSYGSALRDTDDRPTSSPPSAGVVAWSNASHEFSVEHEYEVIPEDGGFAESQSDGTFGIGDSDVNEYALAGGRPMASDVVFSAMGIMPVPKPRPETTYELASLEKSPTADNGTYEVVNKRYRSEETIPAPRPLISPFYDQYAKADDGDSDSDSNEYDAAQSPPKPQLPARDYSPKQRASKNSAAGSRSRLRPMLPEAWTPPMMNTGAPANTPATGATVPSPPKPQLPLRDYIPKPASLAQPVYDDIEMYPSSPVGTTRNGAADAVMQALSTEDAGISKTACIKRGSSVGSMLSANSSEMEFNMGEADGENDDGIQVYAEPGVNIDKTTCIKRGSSASSLLLTLSPDDMFFDIKQDASPADPTGCPGPQEPAMVAFGDFPARLKRSSDRDNDGSNVELRSAGSIDQIWQRAILEGDNSTLEACGASDNEVSEPRSTMA